MKPAHDNPHRRHSEGGLSPALVCGAGVLLVSLVGFVLGGGWALLTRGTSEWVMQAVTGRLFILCTAVTVVCGAGLAVLGIRFYRVPSKLAYWPLCVPLIWVGWQAVAAVGTVDWNLSGITLVHFVTCVGLFFLGWLGFTGRHQIHLVALGLLIGFVWVLRTGFEQHFGGLEATREMFFERPDWREFPADYLKKIRSNRIFSTLVYPNALAGAILLLTPVMLVSAWNWSKPLNNVARGVFVGTLAYAALACLVSSGSKSGWLIALILAVMVLFHLPFRRRWKCAWVGVVLAVGLTVFLLKFADYFRQGALSVGARFDYWRAGVQTFGNHPVRGTGPGTFAISYQQRKAPNSEMARLAHNDYLEQAADSGLIGFVSYLSLFPGSLCLLYRKHVRNLLGFAIWLGLSGWALQGCVEFGLYIPALAWPAFFFLGWLWGDSGYD